MKPVLKLELGTEPVDRAEVELAVAGFFADERPLRGAAGRIDWRLCELISEQLHAGKLLGEPGEAVLLASFGRLSAPHALVVGLGERAHFGRDDVRSHTRDAVLRAQKLGVGSIALAPFGASRLAAGELDLHSERSRSRALLLADGCTELAEDTVSAALDATRGAGTTLILRLLLEVDQVSRVGRSLAEGIAATPEVSFEGTGGTPGGPAGSTESRGEDGISPVAAAQPGRVGS